MEVHARSQCERQTSSLAASATAGVLSSMGPRARKFAGREPLVFPRLPGVQTLTANAKLETTQPEEIFLHWLSALHGWLPTYSVSALDSPVQRCSVADEAFSQRAITTEGKFGDSGAPGTREARPLVQTKPSRSFSVKHLLTPDEELSCTTPPRESVRHRRQCGVLDCHKYALTGGFCIRHGGGKRCSHDGCQTVAQSGGRCKAHGGGSKCKVAGCGSVARRKGFCMVHGGRQQCKMADCGKCAHGGGFCISHGGGKRCSFRQCSKSAQAGGFCYSHGGGKRCSAPECFQAVRKGGFCIRHRMAAVERRDR